MITAATATLCIMNDPTYLASDCTTPNSVLRYLSQTGDLEVRMAVADNKNTATMTLMELAQDNNVDLRYAIAENHNIDSTILNLLARDENPFVAGRAQKTISRLEQAGRRLLL